MKKPIIHLYANCWNDEPMLGFFFDHYDGLVDKYIFFDDGSTDRTLEILQAHPKTEIHKLPQVDQNSYILAAQNTHNNAWKASRGQADWVFVSAVDEFLYHPQMLAYLHSCDRQGITAMPALGYQMMSDTFPAPGLRLTDEIKNGAPWRNMNKLVVFNPDAIDQTNYSKGRHSANPEGKVAYPDTDQVLNLHYKYLSFDFIEQRHLALNQKLRAYDKDKSWGHKYSWDKQRLIEDWQGFKNRLVYEVTSNNAAKHHEHSAISERWWRKVDL